MPHDLESGSETVPAHVGFRAAEIRPNADRPAGLCPFQVLTHPIVSIMSTPRAGASG